MNPEWERINQLFHQALECKDEERADFIARAGQNNPAVLREVQTLLAMHEENHSFMEIPALRTSLSPQFGRWQQQIVDAFRTSAGKNSSETDRMTGQLLDGKYEIEELCGRGGMGAVYRATHVGTGRRVAVKVVAPELAGNREFIERFRREAKMIGLLRHPNIVNITDFGTTGVGGETVAYLVMEYLEGQTLAERLKSRQPMPIDETIAILSQVCAAVDEAHRLGILHRDLKPENIWLEPAGSNGSNVKVLDFGNACLQDLLTFDELEPPPEFDETTTHRQPFSITEEETLRLNYTVQQVSRFGSLMGTPKYMSPEQCRGERLDKASDIYSLGVIAYQMLTGDPPFTGTVAEVLVQHRGADLIPLREKRQEIPAGVDAVVRQALAKEKKARPSAAGTFASQLQLQWDSHLMLQSVGNEWTRLQADAISRKSRWKLFLLAFRTQWKGWLFSLLLLLATAILPAMSSVTSVAVFGLLWLIIAAITIWGLNRTTAAYTLLIGQMDDASKPEINLRSIIHAIRQRSGDLARAAVAEIFSVTRGLIRGCLSLRFSEIRRGAENALMVPPLIEEGLSVDEAKKRSAILIELIRKKTGYPFLRRFLAIALSLVASQVILLIVLPTIKRVMTFYQGNNFKVVALLIHLSMILIIIISAFYLSLKSAIEQTLLYFTARKLLGEVPLEQSTVLLRQNREREPARWWACCKTYVPACTLVLVIFGFEVLKHFVIMEAEIGAGKLYSVKILHASGVPVLRWSLPPYRLIGAIRSPKMVQYLIEKGAEVNAPIRMVEYRVYPPWTHPHRIHQGDAVTTPLMIALAYGSVDAARLLVERGANVHALDSFGRTPMTIAICERPQAIELLLASGVEINELTRFGTPLLIAARYQWPWWPEHRSSDWTVRHKDPITEQDNAVRILIEKGADPNTRDSEGRNALMLMSMESRCDNNLALGDAELTIESRGTIEPRYRWRRRDKAVELTGETLLNAGCDVNAADNKGRTPLMYAVIFERRAAVDLLLKGGADVDAKDHDGLSAVDWAKKSGNEEILRILNDFLLRRSEERPMTTPANHATSYRKDKR